MKRNRLLKALEKQRSEKIDLSLNSANIERFKEIMNRGSGLYREHNWMILFLLIKFTDQLNLHWEKSISGWAFINSFNFYCLSSSSELGSPCCFCLISNIIFSTVDLVSPSRSESLEDSGLIFWVLISWWPLIGVFHQLVWFFHFSILTWMYFPLYSWTSPS